MKPKACDKYRDNIELYSCGELNAAEGDRLLEHVQQCDGCRGYLNALNEQEAKMTQWAWSLEPLMEAGQAQAVERLHLIPEQVVRTTGLLSGLWRYVGYAAAACVLIAAGFLAGRGMHPSLDVESLQQQWLASTRPEMENRITAEVLSSLQSDMKTEYAKLQNALSDQIGIGLQTYAEQTVMRNDLQTYRLLTELIEAIESAQVENQQWALSAMAELESQRLQDQQAVQDQVAVLAAYTGNELFRTQRAIQALSAEKN